jgi:hypothetical protein
MLHDELSEFESRLRKLRLDIRGTVRINKQAPRAEAEALAVLWFQSLKPRLDVLGATFTPHIAEVTTAMERLHVLSRPNNLGSSYELVITNALKQFKDRFLKPIQLAAPEAKTNTVLDAILDKITDPDESGYLREAVSCAKEGFWRASVVMGWCATIDRLQQTIGRIGFDKFNEASTRLKSKTTGKFKNWTKGVQAGSLSELQAVFDTDLLAVLEEMNLIDSNESDRLKVCFQYRNQSAHPSKPPVQDVHLAAFYTDIDSIIFSNPNFAASVASTS